MVSLKGKALWALLEVDLIKLWKSLGIENVVVGIKIPYNLQAYGKLFNHEASIYECV